MLGTRIHNGHTDDDLSSITLMHDLQREPARSYSAPPLLLTTFITKFHEALSKAGMDSHGFYGLGFCLGVMTTAAFQGITDCHVK